MLLSEHIRTNPYSKDYFANCSVGDGDCGSLFDTNMNIHLLGMDDYDAESKRIDYNDNDMQGFGTQQCAVLFQESPNQGPDDEPWGLTKLRLFAGNLDNVPCEVDYVTIYTNKISDSIYRCCDTNPYPLCPPDANCSADFYDKMENMVIAHEAGHTMTLDHWIFYNTARGETCSYPRPAHCIEYWCPAHSGDPVWTDYTACSPPIGEYIWAYTVTKVSIDMLAYRGVPIGFLAYDLDSMALHKNQ